MPAPFGPMMDRISPRRHVERHVLDGGDAAETLGNALDHELIVALLRSQAPGGRPRHEPSLNSASFAYNCRHHAGSGGRRQQICLRFAAVPGSSTMSRHIVCLTFDHDHLSGFIARGLTTPTAISRGEYDVVVIPRLVALLGRYAIKATFFTPGHTIDSTPAGGHALCRGRPRACPSRLDPSPARLAVARGGRRGDRPRQRIDQARSAARPRAATARPPGISRPIRSSCCSKHGIQYDSSLMGHDYDCYYARQGDVAELKRRSCAAARRPGRDADQLVARRLPALRIHAQCPTARSRPA